MITINDKLSYFGFNFIRKFTFCYAIENLDLVKSLSRVLHCNTQWSKSIVMWYPLVKLIQEYWLENFWVVYWASIKYYICRIQIIFLIMAKLRRSILELRYATHRIYNGEFTIFRSTLTQWDETMQHTLSKTCSSDKPS